MHYTIKKILIIPLLLIAQVVQSMDYVKPCLKTLYESGKSIIINPKSYLGLTALTGVVYGAHKYDQYRIRSNRAKFYQAKLDRLRLLKDHLSEETRTLIGKCLELTPMIITKADESGRPVIPTFSDTALSYQNFDDLFDFYFQHIHEDSHFNDASQWVDGNRCDLSFLSQSNSAVFAPYIQKVITGPGSLIVMHGDLHGDVHSLIAFLDDLKKQGILNEDYKIITDAYIAFLGDFTDRGIYGAEAIALIMYLKCINEDRFLLARGNHEDALINTRESRGDGNGFVNELKTKFNNNVSIPSTVFAKLSSLFGFSSSTPEKFEWEILFDNVKKFYETLPLGIFLGTYDANHKITNYYLLCHGGVEVGLDPLPLLNMGSSIAYQNIILNRKSQLEKMASNPEIQKMFQDFYKEVAKVEEEAIKEELEKLIERKIESVQDFTYNLLCNDNSCASHNWVNYKPEGIMMPHPDHRLADMYTLMIGLQWNDYRVPTDHEAFENFKGTTRGQRSNLLSFVTETQGRGWEIGELFNKAVLMLYSDAKNIVRGVMRAHQHSSEPKKPMMCSIFKEDGCDHKENKGLGKLWRPAPAITEVLSEDADNASDKGKERVEDISYSTLHEHPNDSQHVWDNIVGTFNVAPYTPFQIRNKEFNFDTYGILRTAPSYNDWRLQVHRITAQKLLGERFTCPAQD